MITITHRDAGQVLLELDLPDLRGADFYDKDLRGASLRGMDLAGATFYRADLRGADLSGTLLHDADLRDANLCGADLSMAVLVRADLSGADFTGAQLVSANLTDAVLNRVHLSNADLTNADLSNATLYDTDLAGANLRRANLNRADLRYVHLAGANLRDAGLSQASLLDTDLTGTDLTGAFFYFTIIASCSTLSRALGLAEAVHRGASFVDPATLRACANELPDVFLRGVGYTEEEISFFRATYGGAIRYYSCFISYARLNSEFAQRLHNDLEAQNVPCWMDVFDMRGGDYFRSQIDEAIKLHDKVILVCSNEGILRDAVVEEIVTALEVQERTGAQKLFPVKLDEHVFSDEVAAESRRRHQRGEWRMDWVHRIRAFHIPDFSGWRDHDTYQREFQRLLRDLKAG